MSYKLMLQKKMPALVRYLQKIGVMFVVGFWTLAIANVAQAAPGDPAQTPLFLTSSAKPHIALVLSIDNELYKKAYTDYANLDGGSLTMADTTYRDNFNYYGYYESGWCYSYNNSPAAAFDKYFTPYALSTGTNGHECAGTGSNVATVAGAWSGNFLNWMTMTRIDIVRRVLFGGKRSLDTTQTLLERAYLPKDIHAFVKTYAGSDINKFTPYAYDSTVGKRGWSFCNVSNSDDVKTGYPMLRVSEGIFSQWAASEGGQCQLGGSTSPTAVLVDLTVKVDSCVTGKDADTSLTRCWVYGDPSATVYHKPTGLLQKHGQKGEMKFSLMTGSHKSHLKGGVLRKAARLMAGNSLPADDEINLNTGQFTDAQGIIENINALRIAGYSYANGKYLDCNTHSITVDEVKAGVASPTGVHPDAVVQCTDWGNPLAEIYLEMLRYISGKGAPSVDPAVDDSTASGSYPGVAGLTRATWDDPWPADQWCAKCSTIVLSTGSNSFDGDQLTSDIAGLATAANINAQTDLVGAIEYNAAFAGNYFMGGTTNGQRYCKSTALNKLSEFSGICPELPALEGTYNIAGLAYYAHITDLRTHQSDQKLTTYAIDLAENIPTFNIPVGTNTVSFLPACEANTNGGATNTTTNPAWQGCTLIDVKVENLTYSGGKPVSGSFLFYWEDSLWGNDYDLDTAQRLTFCVEAACTPTAGAGKIRINNTAPYAQAGNALRMSYSIYGVSHGKGEWVNNPTTSLDQDFTGGLVYPWIIRPGGTNYTGGIADETTIPNTVGNASVIYTSSATNTTSILKKPLYYAAKYGGFVEGSTPNNKPDITNEWDNQNGVPDGVPDNFFSVSNPAKLEDSLDAVFQSIARKTVSSAAVATSSTRLSENTYIYQAIFNSSYWSGEVRSFIADANGVIPALPTRKTSDTGAMPTSGVGRNVYTYNGTNIVNFSWANLTSAQQSSLQVKPAEVTDAKAQQRVDWLLGNETNENNLTGFRERYFKDAFNTPIRNILGDIVSSTPAFLHARDFQYNFLPSTQGGTTYSNYLTTVKKVAAPRLFVGANDGMLHAFNANTLSEQFAYIPNLIFPQLADLTSPNYGLSIPHKYLVDGAITVGDVYFKGKWHSILVGALGAGGKGIYALDVTNEASPQVLFEYTNPSMGFVLGKLFIVPTVGGGWAVVFGNGVMSGSTSKLFVVDIENPTTNTIILDTAAGAGLSSPAVILDGVGRVTTVYAGDISGNLWHFDLSDSSASNWVGSSKIYKVFTATDTVGNKAQPITAAPTVGFNDILGKNMIYFGTGKYYEASDKDPGSIRNSFYAVPDLGAGNAVSRASLLVKTTTIDQTANTRVLKNPTVNPNWTTQKGWYLDLDFTSGSIDERVTIKPLLLQDKLLITTLLPSSASCVSGGKSWLIEIPAVGDKFVGEHVLPPPPGDPSIGVLRDEIYQGDPTPTVTAPSSNGSTPVCDGSLLRSGTSAVLTTESFKINCGGVGRQTWRQVR